MNIGDFDWGFSLVDESELKENERALAEQLKTTTAASKQAVASQQTKLEQLRSMIMVLLDNLSKEPSKSYLWWPNRVAKVQEFRTKINNLVDNA